MNARWLLAGIPAIAVVCLVSSEGTRSLLAAPMAARARIITSERHDRSRPLRSLPRILPSSSPEREIPRHSRPRPRLNRAAQTVLDPVVQMFTGSPAIPAPSQSFDGVGNISGVLPSDANGDVGPNHFFQTVNLSLAIFSKGTPTTPPALIYGPFAGSTLWNGFGGPCETNNDGDPVVLYDHLADRWVVSELALPNSFFGILIGPFYECIAVSTSPDPTGSYYRYQYAFDKLNDYPKLSVWSDAYYMTTNQFEAVTLTWAGQGVIALDRARMLSGQSASMVYFDLASTDLNLGGMLPADLDGAPPPAGSPGYFMQVDDDSFGYSGDQLQLWKFHTNWANPSSSSFTGPTLLPTAAFDSDLCAYGPCVPQPDPSARLEAISDRLMYRLQYRNFGTHESLVVNHTVDADGFDHAGIRWYEVRDPQIAPVIAQQGTYAPDVDHRFMASAAMDRVGNLGIGFSVSGVTTAPSIRYTGRLASDPPNTLTQGEQALVPGGGSQTQPSGRWGDYTALLVDPADGCTFWYTNQYYSVTSASGWRTRIGSFAFPSCTSATDLPVVTVTASTPTANEAGLTPGRFRFTRTGDTSQPMDVYYTIGGTASPSGDYIALADSVTIAGGSSQATVDVTPIDDVLAEGDETVVLTLSARDTYRIGAPAGGIVVIHSDDQPGDLVVSTLTAPAVGGAGAPLTLTDTTLNQGPGIAGASDTGFYLSTNAVLDASDTFLGSRAVPVLAPGASNTVSTTVTVPPGTANGTYTVLAKADVKGVVAEGQEGNNVKSAIVRIGPDLTVSALTAPSSASLGATITVSDTTSNTGGGAAAASLTKFYLSANATLEASDPLLGSRTVGSLAGLASDAASTTVTVPVNIGNGAYFVMAKADANGAVSETSEANNVRLGGLIRIGGDLAISAFTAPAVGGAGASITVTDTTKNQGADAIAASSTGIYFSANAILEASDTLLGNRAVPSLNVGVSDMGSTTVTIPSGTLTGSYFLIAKADYNDALAEGHEGNNTFLASIRVGPDLTVSALTLPPTAGAGTTINVSDTTANAGGGAAGATTTKFYLSSNVTLDASDTLVGSRPVPALGASASNGGTAVLTIAANTAAGTHYVIAKADGDDALVEALENNNTRAGLLSIGPDLVVAALAAPGVVAPGGSFTVTDTTKNQGAGAASGSSTKFYLSSNITLDAGDTFLGGRTVGALAAGATDAASTVLNIATGQAAGMYYLIAKSDADSQVGETQEANNTRAILIRIGS